MKKLMVAIAAVASAFGLYAADPLVTGTSFEALGTGAFDWTKDDAGQSNAPWWFTTETEVEGTVTEYAGDAYAGPRPDKFVDDPQAKFLALETSKPLYRGATTLNTTSEVVTVDNAFGPQDIGTGFYVDQLVKFTAPSDSEATIDLAGGKIALWLQEVELEENVTATNLMVTAGFFTEGSVTEQKNYVATLADNKDAASLVGSWHRVTIKAIPATTDDIAGFIVYIDCEAVTTDDAIVADDITPAFTTLGAKYEALDQLFPSADFESKNALKIAAVGFQGSGAIDDVSLTEVAPSFAKDDNTIQLDWDPEAFTAITAGGQVLNVADGSTNLTLAAGATTLTIEATAPGCTVSLASEDCGVSGMTFTDIVGSKAGSIIATFNYFEVGEKGYPTFAAALAAAKLADGKITLKGDCTLAAADVGEYGIEIADEADITLDLAGKNLFVGADKTMFYITEGSALTVINSGAADAKIGMGADVEEPSCAVFYPEGSLTIGTAKNEQNFVIVEGNVSDGNDPVALQGKFLQEFVTEKSVVAAWLPEEGGYEVVGEEGDTYWTVKKAGGPEPTNFVIQIVGGEKYETIDAALAAAEDGDELQLLKSVTLDDTLVINKAIKFEMDGNEIKLAADKAIGIDVKAAATIQDGDITSTRETYANNAYMILNEAVNATYKNLNIYAANYKFGLTCDSPGDLADECENAPTVTVTCENVDIIGNGTLFYAQHTILNLDAYCSATKDPTLTSGGYAAAVYSALNATVTIAGGAYEHDYALISGNLGGQIIVNDGEFKGDIKSYMKVGAHTELEGLDGYKAKFVFNAGTYDGDIVFEDDSDEARELDFFKKDDEVTTLAAPTGYQWNETTGVLEKIPPAPVTYTVTFNTNNFAYVTFDAVTNNTPFADLLAEFAEPQIDGYTFKGWTPVVEFITSNSTFEAILEKAGDYPSEDWPEADEAVKAKFSAWRADPEKGAGADLSTDIAKKAFLLNCSVEEAEDTELKITSITVDADGYATIEVNAPLGYGFNIDLGAINGVLYVEAGDKIETMQPRAITYWTTTSGKANVKVQYNFIKAAVGFQKPAVDATEKPPMAEE